MRAHAITSKASTIVPGSILALSLAVVVLAATASTASARFLAPWYCSTVPAPSEQIPRDCLDGQLHPGVAGVPPNDCAAFCSSRFDFGDRQVGTASPAQRFALVFMSNDVVHCSPPSPCPFPQSFSPSINVSGDYVQTNDCPPTLSRSLQIRGCIITVTFAPTGTGPKRGTLSTGTDAAAAEFCGGCPAATGPTVKLSGRGVTRPTPPALPLLLSADVRRPRPRGEMSGGKLDKKVTIRAITNNDSTVVVGGGVSKTTKRLAAGEETKEFKVKLKHLKRLTRRYVENDMVRVTIRFAATDEFGQTATEKVNTVFCRRKIPGDGPCNGH